MKSQAPYTRPLEGLYEPESKLLKGGDIGDCIWDY